MKLSLEELGPELELLAGLVRPVPEPDSLRRLAVGLKDWQAVVAAAQRHGVAPLATRRLRESCQECVPAEALDRLRERWRWTAVRSLALMRELDLLLETVGSRGVRIMPLRGPVLAAALYGDPALRECVDLDILVRRDDLGVVCEALQARGFGPVREWDAQQRALELRDGCEVCYGRADGLYIEPHWELMPRTYPWGLRAEVVWEKARPVEFDGRCIMQPSAEHTFLLLCVHAAKHGWDSLRAVADVAWFLHGTQVDWCDVRELAERARCLRAALVSCALAAALLGVELPRELAGASAGDEALCRRVLSDWLRTAPERLSLRDWTLRWRVLDTPHDKLRFAFRALLAPSVNDLELVRLPRPLFPLYYPLHAARMAVRYGARPLLRRLARG